MILIRSAVRHERIKKLVNKRRRGQWCAVGAPRLQRNIEIFVVETRTKARLEVVLQKTFAVQFQHTARRGAAQ